MPFASVTLRPGVNTEATSTALQAGFATSQLGRFRAGFFEKLGGWAKYIALALGGTPRSLAAWLDLNASTWLAIGTTSALDVINGGVITDITPQTFTSDVTPNFATTSASALVTIVDGNISNVTVLDSVAFNTPVAVGGIILSGVYSITTILSPTSYQITAASNAADTRQNATITGATQANPCVITAANDFANGDLVYISGVSGMTQLNGNVYAISAVGAGNFTLTGIDSTGYGAYTSGGVASPSQVPQFTTTNASATVSVKFADHGLSAGNSIVFPIATTVGGLTIQGTYAAVTITDTDTFTISATAKATSGATASMNTGNVEFVYYITIGPVAGGTGYSFSTYSSGTYSGVGGAGSSQTGTNITATDWTLDNWAATLTACPANGAIYTWTPNSGVQNSQIISGAPFYNSGIFVAAPYQILIAYGSTITKTIGLAQDPLTWRASDLSDYTFWKTNVVNPTSNATSQAFQSRIPTGSAIKAGMATPQQVLFWTDLDLWSATYVNLPQIWTQTKIGANCGTISRHSIAQMSGVVYWMGRKNFHALAGGAPITIPCTVWDAVFQQIDTTNLDKCWSQSVTAFNEIWWFFPTTAGGTGQCDTYAKVNVIDGSWDYGSMPRSIGIDQSVIGNPIMATPTGILYSQENGQNADGQPLVWSFQTGWFFISDGEDFVVVDQWLPDMKWGLFNGAQTATAQVTFDVINNPGDTPRSYGPYTVTSTTNKVDVRFRGRQFRINMTASDLNTFIRMGRNRFRFALSGRR